ncbi:MAG TPA: dockerin type I domain-containing protein [Candidatus Bathyarchaeia archaeon]|nr:dockerin type I domain-containing protein [Candidatus Bathyarchaeia archaeon]
MISLKKPIFLSKLSKKQLISLASFLIILISLPLAIFLTKQQQSYQGRAVGPEARPAKVKITNLHGGGFSVSWASVSMNDAYQFIDTTGWVEYGTAQNSLNQTAYDDRGGEDVSSTTHHVSIFYLNPDTTYYFKIKSGPYLFGLNVAGDGWVRGGAAKEQKTPKTLDLLGNPHPAYGYIKNQTGNIIGNALAYVRLKKDGSDTQSALLSTVTRANEGWVVDLKNARSSGLGNFFNFDNQDRVLVEIQAAEKGTASADFAVSGSSPAPDIALASPTVPTATQTIPPTATPTPTGGPAATSTPTPTPLPTATPTPSPKPTPTPLPTPTPTPLPPTATPTSTPTQVPNTVNLDFQVKFQGINNQKPVKTAKITLKKPGESETAHEETVNFNSNQSGVWSGRIMNISPGTYDLYIKGWAHLQKKFEGITLAEGENSQDFSGTSLLAGDINDNNRIEALDLAIVIEHYWPDTPANSPADFNLDGSVNALDIGLVIENYFLEGDS